MDAKKREALELIELLLDLKIKIKEHKIKSPAFEEFLDVETKAAIDYINFCNR